LERSKIEHQLRLSFRGKKKTANMKAFDLGYSSVTT